MRLAELIQALPVPNLKSGLVDVFRRELRTMPIIVVDNVCEYLRRGGGDWVNGEPDLLAPPFPEFWMEYKYPFAEGMQYIGARCREIRAPEWGLHLTLFVCQPNILPTVVSPGYTLYRLDRDGRYAYQDGDEFFLNKQGMGHLTDEQAGRTLGKWLYPIKLGIMLMHWKKIVVIEHAPPPKLAKRNAERGKPPMLKFQTLEINPIKRVLKEHGGDTDSAGLTRALHQCRGHFAYYPESGPGLFGRIHGVIFRHAHMRGTPTKGIVVSDPYKVKTPPEGDQ